MYILDTDHIGILQRVSDSHYSVLSQRISQHSQSDFYVTVVSFPATAPVLGGYARMT